MATTYHSSTKAAIAIFCARLISALAALTSFIDGMNSALQRKSGWKLELGRDQANLQIFTRDTPSGAYGGKSDGAFAQIIGRGR